MNFVHILKRSFTDVNRRTGKKKGADNMQAIMETAFDAVYLITVIALGVLMIFRSRGNRQHLLFGIMAVTLGCGDAFHLIPRAYALCTTGLQDYTFALGVGKMITSITMTVFYILLYHVWQLRYGKEAKRGTTAAMYLLAVARMVLCLFPQNGWTSEVPPLSWGIVRNIPFAAMGAWVIVLFYQEARKQRDEAFRHMWLTIVLSFAFYIPVVLFSERVPMLGMLMIPKTCAYVWTVCIGFNDMRRAQRSTAG